MIWNFERCKLHHSKVRWTVVLFVDKQCPASVAVVQKRVSVPLKKKWAIKSGSNVWNCFSLHNCAIKTACIMQRNDTDLYCTDGCRNVDYDTRLYVINSNSVQVYVTVNKLQWCEVLWRSQAWTLTLWNDLLILYSLTQHVKIQKSV